MKYLNKFDTKSDYEEAASTLEIPNVAYITATTEVIYNATQPKAYVVFADPLVASKCATLYGDGVGCTEADLGAVTVMSVAEWSGTNITSFDEFQYFTGVTSFQTGLFRDCSALTSVVIPDSVTYLDAGTFYGCTSLSSVTLGNSVGRIWMNAFYGCTSLSSITFPESVTRIDGQSFLGCSSLSSITFVKTTPPGTIANDAFQSVPSTGNITVPSGSESNFYALAQAIGANWTVNNQAPPAPPASNYVLFESSALTAASDVCELTLDGVTILGYQYGTVDGVVFTATTGYRFYRNCFFDIIATDGNITKIEFTQTSGTTYAVTNINPVDSTVGTYTVADGVGTWVASSTVSTVSFTNPSGHARCSSIKVYLE